MDQHKLNGLIVGGNAAKSCALQGIEPLAIAIISGLVLQLPEVLIVLPALLSLHFEQTPLNWQTFAF